MRISVKWAWLVSIPGCATILSSGAAVRQENFDREPPNWEGVNNRNKFFEPKTVEQNFGYSATTSHAGGQAGEIGGRINPAGEPAYYCYPLPKPLNLDSPMTAEGRLFVASGSGHCLLGFFNTNTLKELRTPNTLTGFSSARGYAVRTLTPRSQARPKSSVRPARRRNLSLLMWMTAASQVRRIPLASRLRHTRAGQAH